MPNMSDMSNRILLMFCRAQTLVDILSCRVLFLFLILRISWHLLNIFTNKYMCLGEWVVSHGRTGRFWRMKKKILLEKLTTVKQGILLCTNYYEAHSMFFSLESKLKYTWSFKDLYKDLQNAKLRDKPTGFPFGTYTIYNNIEGQHSPASNIKIMHEVWHLWDAICKIHTS